MVFEYFANLWAIIVRAFALRLARRVAPLVGEESFVLRQLVASETTQENEVFSGRMADDETESTVKAGVNSENDLMPDSQMAEAVHRKDYVTAVEKVATDSVDVADDDVPEGNVQTTVVVESVADADTAVDGLVGKVTDSSSIDMCENRMPAAVAEVDGHGNNDANAQPSIQGRILFDEISHVELDMVTKRAVSIVKEVVEAARCIVANDRGEGVTCVFQALDVDVANHLAKQKRRGRTWKRANTPEHDPWIRCQSLPRDYKRSMVPLSPADQNGDILSHTTVAPEGAFRVHAYCKDAIRRTASDMNEEPLQNADAKMKHRRMRVRNDKILRKSACEVVATTQRVEKKKRFRKVRKFFARLCCVHKPTTSQD